MRLEKNCLESVWKKVWPVSALCLFIGLVFIRFVFYFYLKLSVFVFDLLISLCCFYVNLILYLFYIIIKEHYKDRALI